MANDFHRVEFGSPRPSRPSAEARSTPPAAAPPASGAAPDQPPRPADGVLVPLDQWNRILGQLGNIHEAGQQLADARERMARAETENEFLKERIRHLRSQVADNDAAGAGDDVPEPAVTPPAAAATGPARRRRKLQIEVGLPAWITRRRSGPPTS